MARSDGGVAVTDAKRIDAWCRGRAGRVPALEHLTGARAVTLSAWRSGQSAPPSDARAILEWIGAVPREVSP